MKKQLLLVAFFVLLGALNATLLLEDNFTGTVGTLLTANGWVAHNGAGSTPMSIASPGLEYPGYLSSGIGNATSASANGEDVNKTFTPTSTGSLYYAFMINTAMTATSSGYSIHFNQSSSIFYARFYQRLVSGNVNFGLTKSNEATIVWDPANYSLNTTYLVVLKYAFVEGTTTDDVVSMWVNPVLGDSEPTPNLSFTVGTVSDATSLTAAAIRQWNTGTLSRFDGIRVGTSWADVGASASTPAISVVGSLTEFATFTGTPSAPQSYIVSGSNLENDIDVSAPGGFELSLQTDSGWTGFMSLPQTGGSVPATTVYVRLTGTDGSGTFSGNIAHVSSPATTENLYASGTVTDPEPTVYVSETNLTGFGYIVGNGPSAEQSFTVSGVYLTSDITVTAPTNYEISTTSGTNFDASVVLSAAKLTVSETTLYVRLKAGLPAGLYNDEAISIATAGVTTQYVECDGSVAAPLDNIFISEYIEGGSNNKAIEIYNASDATVDLSRYRLRLYFNGSSSIGQSIALAGTLSPDDVFVIANGSASAEILALADLLSGSLTFNGDDAVELYCADPATVLDRIGVVGIDPGSGWDVAGVTTGTLNHTMVRKPNVAQGNLDWPSSAGTDATDSEWIVYAQDVIDYLGFHTFDDGTVPVELSSFTAVLTAENNVNLIWVTQSETGVQGYYIYRNTSSELADAILASPLIEGLNSSDQQIYSFTDSEIFEPGTYYYWLQNVDYSGDMDFHGPVSVVYSHDSEEITPELPLLTQLHDVFPNPFNPAAIIPFSVAKSAEVDIRIFNSRGQLMRHYSLANRAPGTYQIVWDGKDSNGRECSTGVYYIRMDAGKDTFQRKAVLMK